MSAVVLDVAADTPLWDALPEAEALALRAVATAAAMAGVTLHEGAEASLLLTSDARMREINRQWRAQDKPTNVLSFPAVPPARLAAAPFLGDVAVAFETLRREAEEEGRALADHFTHLVVHGFLHLVGHDHVEEAEAERMERLETAVLARLGVPDPHAAPALDCGTESATMIDRR